MHSQLSEGENRVAGRRGPTQRLDSGVGLGKSEKGLIPITRSILERKIALICMFKALELLNKFDPPRVLTYNYS